MVDDWTSCTGQWLCNQLSDGDKSSDLLLLDCRSADEYTSSHVAGSLLIVVPTMMLRRLRNGNVSVSAAISPNSSSRAVFSDRCRTSHVVLYDTSGDSLGSGADSVIQVLMNGLQKDGCRVSYLLGNILRGYLDTTLLEWVRSTQYKLIPLQAVCCRYLNHAQVA